MISLISDLFGHEAWADAEHWRAINALPAAGEDRELCDRLHHLHLVQRGYLKLLLGEPFDVQKEQEPFPSLKELELSARRYHERMAALVATLSAAGLKDKLEIRWFSGFNPTLGEALVQVAMHSHYHRGQNATRLKQLGAQPPMTDFIAWVHAGRPEPRWP